VSYYDGDPWSNHQLNEIKCGECEKEYDEQEGEGNICPTCKEKEGEKMDTIVIKWSVDDIQALKPFWTREKCQAFLNNKLESFRQASISQGWEIWEVLLEGEGE
jgi:hypothetical protein